MTKDVGGRTRAENYDQDRKKFSITFYTASNSDSVNFEELQRNSCLENTSIARKVIVESK